MTKVKLVILDLYGVMVAGSYHDTCHWLAKKYHRREKDLYAVIYHKYFNMAAMGKITERQAFEFAIKELGLKETYLDMRKKHLSFMKLNRQVFRLALNLQKKGYAILLLSKNVPGQFNWVVRENNLKKYFKNIVNAYDWKLPKASKKTMLKVMKEFKVKPSEIIFVDDQDFNLVEANRMGVKTIVYKNFSGLKNKLSKHLF